MRYELEPKARGRHVCFVGYDKGLNTFYVYVAGAGGTDRRGQLTQSNHVVLWRGTAEREVTTVEEVKRLVSEYATLPAEIERALRACAEGETATEAHRSA